MTHRGNLPVTTVRWAIGKTGVVEDGRSTPAALLPPGREAR